MLMTDLYNVSNSVEKWGQKEKTSFQIVEGYSFIPVNRYTCISSIFNTFVDIEVMKMNEINYFNLAKYIFEESIK